MFEVHYETDEFARLQVPYQNKSERFILGQRNFLKQYYHIYISRLSHISESLRASATRKWGDKVPVIRLCDLREEKPERCIAIGTLVKQQALKPTIFHELTAENRLRAQSTKATFWDSSDRMFLEDDLNRIELVGKISIASLVTGVVAAVLGYENESGEFVVEEVIFYNPEIHRPLKTLATNPLLVLVSGIDQSSQKDFSLSLDLFQQWIYGNLDGFGGGRDYEAAAVVRVIFAGNSIRSTADVRKKSSIRPKMPDSMDELNPVKRVDELISGLSRSVYVDLMPGPHDPSNQMLPQQPMHLCMFPESSKTRHFNSVPNPYFCEISDRVIIGTSGQNVHDVQKYADVTALEALESTLQWGHIAPTCPDTLPCYPFIGKDPLIVDEMPHLYFSGNAKEFATKLIETEEKGKIRLVCVPAFHDTQSVAVVNLNTLDCKEISFKINPFDEMEE